MAMNNEKLKKPKAAPSPKKAAGTASKLKTNDEPVKPRNVIEVRLRNKDENPDDATARELMHPSVQAAITLQAMQSDVYEVNALARELSVQIAAVNKGDMSRPEALLIAQAHTLDALFHNLVGRARGQNYLPQYEAHFRLALKAQSQCRATLETLANIKNPPIVYARQANVTTGPQQINNGVPSRAREIESEQNKLLEVQHGERLDIAATSKTGQADPQLATVATLNRPENGKG